MDHPNTEQSNNRFVKANISKIENLPEKIEILSTELLDQNRPIVNRLRELAAHLHIELGWHYLLDLTWTIVHLGPVSKLKILDAGAGVGILQWYLAQAGAELVSVDRSSRALLPLRFRNRFSVHGFNKSDLAPAQRVMLNYLNQPIGKPALRQLAGRGLAIWRDAISFLTTSYAKGSIAFYHQDLRHLVDIKDHTFDAVVSISALEHNSQEDLALVVQELLRVIKPGGPLIATLGAARDQDWYHKPSSGWCYTDQSLRRLFGLSPSVPSNYAHHDELFKMLKECDELRSGLARFYSQSSNTGMPGGVWNPEYQPVGVIKIRDNG
jgi:2-polyprenyl-3-methyl-5-hydroxy-6-metoxy-1,4-benzoquinol methylase